MKNLNIELSDLEKSKLSAFNADPELSAVVRKVLLASAYAQGTINPGKEQNPQSNWALSLAWGSDELSNEQIGAKVVAIGEAIKFIQSGFKEIENVRVPVAKKVPVNKAI